MKPNGFVFAASMTSQTSMSSLWHIWAISFTSPMFTARNVFSSSFTISATRAQVTRGDNLRERCLSDIGDVAVPAIQLRDLRGVDVKPGHVETGLRELNGQRQPDISEADDADACLFRTDSIQQGL